MRKKSYNNFVIPLMVYPFDVMVSIGEHDEELFRKLKRYNIAPEDMLMAKYDNNGNGRYCMFACGASLLRIKSKPQTPFEYATLQHEIFHVAASVMWKIGMRLEIQVSDEAYSYLIQYLTEQIYKRI